MFDSHLSIRYLTVVVPFSTPIAQRLEPIDNASLRMTLSVRAVETATPFSMGANEEAYQEVDGSASARLPACCIRPKDFKAMIKFPMRRLSQKS